MIIFPHSLATRGDGGWCFSQGIWALAILGGAVADFVSRSDGPVNSFVLRWGAFSSGVHFGRRPGMVGQLAEDKRRDSRRGARDGDQRQSVLLATGITVMVIVVAKFCRGARGVVVVAAVCRQCWCSWGGVRRHYEWVGERSCADECDGSEVARKPEAGRL